ncbi:MULTISPECIES: TerD family protein [unclassified Bacillus (in: firmicutes)]|uniref:TerD family protein n=1 Tax=unclassified Bacillus (in: firmicutes) TaxID=185979 RepID=UPI0008F0E6A5|nr:MULTISPECIES: TerD family protein [unclassified Bacillus (in: firmicutes)]SFB13386.1 tellurium resistance protein TerD [Bacillus sp. UNCCL13]SFQ90029.1 tellurium resistance protein TerD [Bacillus sp. cl95]
MGVTLSKGQKVDLTKSHPGLQNVVVGLGWDVSQHSAHFDLDASTFLLGQTGKVQSDQDFIFYNNPSGGNGSILYSGDNRTGTGERDDEQIRIDLGRVPQHIHRIAFTITIHDAQMKGQSFGQVSNAYVRILNERNGEELIRFNLGRDFTVETAIVASELYRHNGEWKFNAIASGFQGGLAALCRNFGVSVDDAPAPPPPTQNFGGQDSFNQQNFNGQSGFGSQNGMGSPQGFGQTGFGSQNQSSYGTQNNFGQQHTYPTSNQGSFSQNQMSPSHHNLQPLSSSQTYGGDSIACPRCHSTNVRTGQKGFGIGKAAIGGLILGPVGLLGGFIGKNQLKFSCNSCGNGWSPNQTDYMEWANQQKRRAMELFNRYKSQDVLDAVVAACALVGMADGRLDPAERQKMLEFVNQSEELRVFDTNKVIQQFNHFVQRIEYDFILGRAEAFRALGKVRSKPEIARLVARFCIAIGFADGHFDKNEQQMVSEICRELGLNPAEFLS